MGTISAEQFNLRKHSQGAQGTEISEDSFRQGRQLVFAQVPLHRSLGKRDNAEQRRERRRSSQCRSAMRL